MQLRPALNAAIERLTAAHVPSPRMNAELLIMFTLDCDRAYLYAHPERELTADEVSRYEAALARRATGVPAQYITGHQEFWGMDLIVSPAVLIPRPETEHVVEAVLEIVGFQKENQSKIKSKIKSKSKSKNKIKGKIKGRGQECPRHMLLMSAPDREPSRWLWHGN